jgi:hypothetical protein
MKEEERRIIEFYLLRKRVGGGRKEGRKEGDDGI